MILVIYLSFPWLFCMFQLLQKRFPIMSYYISWLSRGCFYQMPLCSAPRCWGLRELERHGWAHKSRTFTYKHRVRRTYISSRSQNPSRIFQGKGTLVTQILISKVYGLSICRAACLLDEVLEETDHWREKAVSWWGTHGRRGILSRRLGSVGSSALD